jgi:hypothetical protein
LDSVGIQCFGQADGNDFDLLRPCLGNPVQQPIKSILSLVLFSRWFASLGIVSPGGSTDKWLCHPSRHGLYDSPQTALVGRHKQPRQCPLNRATRLDGAQGLDCAGEGFALFEDAVGECRVYH